MVKDLSRSVEEIPEDCVLIGGSVYVHTAGNRLGDITGPASLLRYVARNITDYLKDGFRD